MSKMKHKRKFIASIIHLITISLIIIILCADIPFTHGEQIKKWKAMPKRVLDLWNLKKELVIKKDAIEKVIVDLKKKTYALTR